MGSLAKDARYRTVKNINCPSCFQGHVETIVKIPNGNPNEPELVYAECEPYGCRFNQAHRDKLLRNSMEFIKEYEDEKERRGK